MAGIINQPPGKAHLAAKPQCPTESRPIPPRGQGIGGQVQERRWKRGRQEGGDRGMGQHYPPQRREDRKEVIDCREETEPAAEEEGMEEGDRDVDTARGHH